MPDGLAEAAFAMLEGQLTDDRRGNAFKPAVDVADDASRAGQAARLHRPPALTARECWCAVAPIGAGPGGRWCNGAVARLGALDLTLRLSREQEAEQLEAAQRRLLHLRLVLGGLVDGGRLGPPSRAVRGLGRVRQGRRDQAARRSARPSPCARGAVRRAHARTRSVITSLLASCRRYRAGAGWRCSTVRGTAACSSSVSTASRRESNGTGATTRSCSSSVRWPSRGRSSSSCGCTSRTRSSSKVREPARRPAEELEAHARRLAQPREACRIRDRRPRRCSSARTTRSVGGISSRPRTSGTRGEGHPDRDQPHRRGHAPPRLRAAAVEGHRLRSVSQRVA